MEEVGVRVIKYFCENCHIPCHHTFVENYGVAGETLVMCHICKKITKGKEKKVDLYTTGYFKGD